ncbi:hypothetical protein AURDEDRAFT_172840 [Auricularia subglabra TFB-10046 SS5]|uniref:Uncharacterized protein n=1 Tax=Auricularia subglabra (strain TFB-10046 / SS5) TaxID=717982 RepID=J0DBM1_AURST|nr:hypothetical protein AURDEDRAFT_172840 [Auricularia subglabra TFB-10046 SS5]
MVSNHLAPDELALHRPLLLKMPLKSHLDTQIRPGPSARVLLGISNASERDTLEVGLPMPPASQRNAWHLRNTVALLVEKVETEGDWGMLRQAGRRFLFAPAPLLSFSPKRRQRADADRQVAHLSVQVSQARIRLTQRICHATPPSIPTQGSHEPRMAQPAAELACEKVGVADRERAMDGLHAEMACLRSLFESQSNFSGMPT